MKCKNIFCIYERNGTCSLDKVELDIMGQCEECIYLNLNEHDLNKLKKKQSET